MSHASTSPPPRYVLNINRLACFGIQQPNPPTRTHESLRSKNRSPEDEEEGGLSCPGIDTLLFHVNDELVDRFCFGENRDTLHLEPAVGAGEIHFEHQAHADLTHGTYFVGCWIWEAGRKEAFPNSFLYSTTTAVPNTRISAALAIT